MSNRDKKWIVFWAIAGLAVAMLVVGCKEGYRTDPLEDRIEKLENLHRQAHPIEAYPNHCDPDEPPIT